MDEAKRMEEGLNSQLKNDDDANNDGLKKQEMNNGYSNSTIEHDRDTMARPEVGESVKQIAEQEQPVLIKQKTKRVATLDAFRGLTIVVSWCIPNLFFWQSFCNNGFTKNDFFDKYTLEYTHMLVSEYHC